MQSSKSLAVLGAGPAGTVLAMMLAKKGYTVDLYDKGRNPSQGIDQTKRQINYGVSLRGVKALEEIGVWEKVRKHSIPMYGRTIHNYNGTLRSHQYGRKDQGIYSIRSEVLKNLLLQKVPKTPNIRIHFETQIADIDIH